MSNYLSNNGIDTPSSAKHSQEKKYTPLLTPTFQDENPQSLYNHFPPSFCIFGFYEQYCIMVFLLDFSSTLNVKNEGKTKSHNSFIFTCVCVSSQFNSIHVCFIHENIMNCFLIRTKNMLIDSEKFYNRNFENRFESLINLKICHLF